MLLSSVISIPIFFQNVFNFSPNWALVFLSTTAGSSGWRRKDRQVAKDKGGNLFLLFFFFFLCLHHLRIKVITGGKKRLVPYLTSVLLPVQTRTPLAELGISRRVYLSFPYLTLFYPVSRKKQNQFPFYLCLNSYQIICTNIIHSSPSSRTKAYYTVEQNCCGQKEPLLLSMHTLAEGGKCFVVLFSLFYFSHEWNF